MKINTFIFDCFGVVCSPVLNGWYKENILKKGQVDDNFKNLCKNFDLGLISEDDILEYFLKYQGITSSKNQLREDVDGYLSLDYSLVGIIKELKNKGMKIVLLSNANNAFFERMVYVKYPEFKTLFDEIVISSNIRMVKPNSDIYLYTLEKINSKPEESVFIDDSMENVEAAKNLGINGFLYTESTSFDNYVKSLDLK